MRSDPAYRTFSPDCSWEADLPVEPDTQGQELGIRGPRSGRSLCFHRRWYALQRFHPAQCGARVCAPAPWLEHALAEGVPLAMALNTEKARSEFLIAPVLLDVRRLFPGQASLFSGVLFDVDPVRGLTGYADFLLSRSGSQLVLTAPVVVVVEAKNDNLSSGLGQCLATMVAARCFNTGRRQASRRFSARSPRAFAGSFCGWMETTSPLRCVNTMSNAMWH